MNTIATPTNKEPQGSRMALLALWVKGRMARILSEDRDRYLQYLVSRYRYCEMKGLTTQGFFHLALPRVFVEPNLVSYSAQKRFADIFHPLPHALQTGQHSIWDYLQSDSEGAQRLMLLGAPGSGKTTLLQHIVLTLAAEEMPPSEESTLHSLPILLSLSEVAGRIKNSADTTLAQAVQDSLLRFKTPVVSAEWLQRQLEKGHCLVMLDGLDEVADPTVRMKVTKWIETQMRTFSNNRFLVTSRPGGYESQPLHGVHVLEICPFTQEQQERFVQNWCLTSESFKASRENEEVRSAAGAAADELLQQLYSAPALTPLVGGPLLLTIMANVYGFHNMLPRRRWELYADLCHTSLRTFQRPGEMSLDLTPLDLTPAQKQNVLRPLAYAMMVREVREISFDDAVTIIREPLRKVSEQIKPEQFLKGIVNESGLLLSQGNGIVRFAHQTLQEYLAAMHIHEQKLESELTERVGQIWWQETVRFFCAGTNDATPVLTAALEIGRPTLETLVRIEECMEEAKGLEPPLRERMEALMDQQRDHLHQQVENEGASARRVAAETLLALRLRRMTRTCADRCIDNSLITHAEYQLFLDEQYAQREYRQPDHWKSRQFSAGQGHAPAVGIRPGDAMEFCAWLTQRESGDWSYRLPTVSELDEEILEASDAAQKPIGYWVISGERTKCHRLGAKTTMLEEELLYRWFDRDFKRALHPARMLDTGLDLNNDRTLDLALVLALDRTRALDCGLLHTLDLANTHALDAELDRALKLNHGRTNAHALGRVHSLTRALAIARTRALDRALHEDLEYTRILALAISAVLIDVLERIPASQREELGEFVEIIERQQEAYMDLYVSMVMLEERRRGNLPAVEGIRIVRERIADSQ